MGDLSPIPPLVAPTTVVEASPARGEPPADTRNFPTLGRIVRLDPRLDELLAPDSRIEVLASGFEWSEGPVWWRDEGCLLFSDIPRNAIFRWKEGEGLSLFMKPSGYTGITPYGPEPGSNGLTVDGEGRLVLCEHGDRRVARLERDGGKRTLADSYQGRRLNSPNDLVYRSNGDLLFTDPPYGLPERWDDPHRELPFCGVFCLSAVGALTLVTAEMSRPNGLALSPDERTLYVANSDSERPIWMAFPLRGDGTAGEGRLFWDAAPLARDLPGGPDGLKVDRKGNLFATGPGGLCVLTPGAELLGRVETGERISNCGWGDDGGTLYFTSDMYLCRVRTLTRGAGW